MKLVGEFYNIKIYTINDNEMVLSKDTAEVFAGYMKRIFPMMTDTEQVKLGSKKNTKHKTDVSKYHYLSELLICKIKASGTEMLIQPERDIPKWAQDFRLMVEQDKKTENQIEEKIEAVFADDFWSKQIRSASKFRKQWNDGKLDKLKGSQNSCEGQEPAKKLTPWQELCRDSGDPCQRVFDKFINTWHAFDPNAYRDWYAYPEEISRNPLMEKVFYIIREYQGRSNVEMVAAVKKFFEDNKNAR